MSGFLQDPPRPSNRFRTDRALRRALERTLPAEILRAAAPDLDAMGAAAAAELRELGSRVEANPPRHVAYDAWGGRADRIETDPAWSQLLEIGYGAGLASIPYEDRFGEHGRVVQAGLHQLYGPVSADALCPIGMTDAAARCLLANDEALAAWYVPRLTAREGTWSSGQWMTETAGGSDVSRTATVARPGIGDRWTLHGTKWFTSATTAEIALALARPEGAEEGSRGLSLFLLELRRPDGSWNGITVRRLKDKLGTRGVPTAELELDGAVAVPVGGIGRGVAKIASMLTVTRAGVAGWAVSFVGEALSLARDYAGRREALGRPLAAHPVHRSWIASIAARYEAMLALSFRASELLGRHEHGDEPLARIVVPLAKLACARQAVDAVSRLIESFGGAGYVEDTGLPRLLRNVHVHCIWEGTTSVVALDVLRALRGEGLAEAFLADVEERARSADHPPLAGPVRRVLAARDELAKVLADAEERDAARLAWGMARTYQGGLLCEAAGWGLARSEDPSAATAAALFTADPLVPPDADVPEDAEADLAFPRV